MLRGEVRGQLRAADQTWGDAENDRAIGVAHVPFGALGVAGRRRFLQAVTPVDFAVFRDASSGTPAAVGNAVGDGEIQRRAVSTGLSAGNNFLQQTTFQSALLIFLQPPSSAGKRSGG